MFKISKASELDLDDVTTYLIDGLIPSQDITVVWGKPKSGKSFWILDAAVHIAAGLSYRGKTTISGPVVYCAFEGGPMVKARIRAAIKNANIEHDIPLYLCSECYAFNKVGGSDELVKSVESSLDGQNPVLIILDTLNRSMEGSENSDQDMSFYLKCIEKIGARFSCALVVIHHCGISGDKPRGHTSLTGTCAAQIKIARANKLPVGEGKPMMISATVEFMKDGPEGAIEYSWIKHTTVTSPKGKVIKTCYIVEAPEPADFEDELNVLTGYGKKALSILQEMLHEVDEYRISIAEWRTQFQLNTKGKKESTRRAFYRAYDALELKGLITVEGPWVSLPSSENSKSNPGI